MLRPLLLLLTLIPSIAFARLGETEAQLLQRFGEPVSRGTDPVLTQGKIINLCPLLTFQQNNWRIACALVEGHSSQEKYTKAGDWTEEQLSLVLTSSAQVPKWQDVSNPSLQKLRRDWKRPDGATAIWKMGVGFVLTHPAYPRAVQQAKDNAKAEAARLPNL